MADGDVLQLSRSSASLLNIYSLVCSSTLIFYSSTTPLIFYASTSLLVYTYLLLAYSPLSRSAWRRDCPGELACASSHTRDGVSQRGQDRVGGRELLAAHPHVSRPRSSVLPAR